MKFDFMFYIRLYCDFKISDGYLLYGQQCQWVKVTMQATIKIKVRGGNHPIIKSLTAWNQRNRR